MQAAHEQRENRTLATARELRNKIRSISNTKKITRTMEMIATAKARVCQKRIDAVKPYGEKLTEMLRDLQQGAGDAAQGFPLLRQPERIRREALIVITANRGLCGGYNTNALRLAEQHLRQRQQEGVETEVHMVGKKGIARFRFLKRPLAGTYTQFDDKPAFAEAERLLTPFIERFARGELDAVTIVSTRYLNAARQAPRVHAVLPLGAAAAPAAAGGTTAAGHGAHATNFIFEPSPEEIIGTLLPLSIRMQLFQALVEASTSEQIARRIAMKNATDNAEEMVRQYTQLYNRTRQAGITQEILEVIGGAEGL